MPSPPDAPLCPACAFDLTGIDPSCCPECGAEVLAPLYADARPRLPWHAAASLVWLSLLFGCLVYLSLGMELTACSVAPVALVLVVTAWLGLLRRSPHAVLACAAAAFFATLLSPCLASALLGQVASGPEWFWPTTVFMGAVDAGAFLSLYFWGLRLDRRDPRRGRVVSRAGGGAQRSRRSSGYASGG